MASYQVFASFVEKMKSRNPCAPRLKLVQQEPFGFSPTFAQLRVSRFSPRTPESVAVTMKSPTSRRTPRFHCRDRGTLALLSISHASGLPVVRARVSSVALLAVRYASFQTTSPAPGVESGLA